MATFRTMLTSLLVPTVWCGFVDAAGQLSKDLDSAFQSARTSVVRVVSTLGTGDVSQGSAVLLKKVKGEGGQTYGYFVTCAHVIEGSSKAPGMYQFQKNGDMATAAVGLPEGLMHFIADL